MKLLIVDDSALMRRVLQDCFADDPNVETFTARDGEDALAQIDRHDPDVVTLDINMPVMDGLTCLAHIMESAPRPVIMVSSLTEKGALATFEALELGAVDFVAKPGGTVSLNMEQVFAELRAKTKSAARQARLRRDPAPPTPAPPELAPPDRTHGALPGPVELVLIGCSTGGPKTVGPLLEDLPPEFPAPIVIAQHMPERFTGIFAARLAESCAIGVSEVTAPTELRPGHAYFAPGGRDMLVARRDRGLIARPVAADDGYTWHPSVSRMVGSALGVVPADRLVAIMLTGMGDDGADEMARLHREGGRTIAESKETAAIFGMPEKLIARKGASLVLPAPRISGQLKRWLSRQPSPRTEPCP